jgi:hypothetical protein
VEEDVVRDRTVEALVLERQLLDVCDRVRRPLGERVPCRVDIPGDMSVSVKRQLSGTRWRFSPQMLPSPQPTSSTSAPSGNV